MSKESKLSLIQPLVEHLMQQQDAGAWRLELIDSGILGHEEVMELEQKALATVYKTLKTMQLLHQNADDIINAIEEHNVCWKIDLGYDYQHGVICY